MGHQDQPLSDRLAEIKGAKVVKSFCFTCPWTCPTEVYVRDGKVVITKATPRRRTISVRAAPRAWRAGG